MRYWPIRCAFEPTATPNPWEPIRDVHLLDLQAQPPRIVATVQTGRQPSGISIAPDGQLALVANRADGTVTALSLHGDQLQTLETVTVAEPSASVSDVAIDPNGQVALVSVQKGGYLAVLKLKGTKVSVTDTKLSVYGQPYRVVITPDGALGLTAGQGFGENGVDNDALSVVDMRATPIRTIRLRDHRSRAGID